MKTLTPILATIFCASSLVLSQSAINADGLYKWKDARGNIQYGDQPPANANAKSIDLPKITIIDNYADQWRPMKFDETQAIDDTQQEKPHLKTNTYTKLVFVAPKKDQAIRANDGDVSAIISIKPPLKKGHKLEFSIDGKSMGKGTSRTMNFSNLDRGSHTIVVNVLDKQGKTLKSNSVGFNVLRANLRAKIQLNRANKATQTKSFQNTSESNSK